MRLLFGQPNERIVALMVGRAWVPNPGLAEWLIRVVLDTNIFVGACLGQGACSQVMGSTLFQEHEAVPGRDMLFEDCRLSQVERSELLDIYLARCEWTRIYFGWRPNLRDESDIHVVELAIAGGAQYLVTRNMRDFTGRALSFPRLGILTPETFLKELTP